jgi:hypothetical protein
MGAGYRRRRATAARTGARIGATLGLMVDPAMPDADADAEPARADPTPALAPGDPSAAPAPALAPAASSAGRPRPILERIGMAVIALVLAALFAVVALAAFAGGEPFLGAMSAIGCLMVLWVGGLTLFKGR